LQFKWSFNKNIGYVIVVLMVVKSANEQIIPEFMAFKIIKTRGLKPSCFYNLFLLPQLGLF